MSRWIILALATILRLSFQPLAQTPHDYPAIADTVPVDAVVKQLGSDDRDVERIKFLARHPAKSARFLIQELHAVDGVRILSQEQYDPKWKDAEHVVWSLRALRTITGALEFRAKASNHFDDSEIERNCEWFTGGEQFKKDGTVHFFGVWMSRDSLCIAPKDAQEKIIQS